MAEDGMTGEDGRDEQYPDGAEYELTEMEIHTVGLVPKGANRMSFFLLKEDKDKDKEDYMTDELNIEEVVDETAAEGFWQRFRTEAANIFKAAPPAQEPEPEPDATGPEEDDDEPEPDDEPEELPAGADADGGTLEKLLKAQTDRFEALLKAQAAQYDRKLDKVEAELAKANERAARAETYAAEQTELAERQEYLQKATGYRAVPVSTKELGDMLYGLGKKLDAEQYGQVEAVLKAMDKQAWTAGLFAEAGTARTPAEADLQAKLAKAAKDQGVSEAEALLTLPMDEQLALQKQWDEEG